MPRAGARRAVCGVERPSVRTLRLTLPDELAGHAPDLCQELALHDWLLSTVVALLDRARIGRLPRAEVVRRLGPVLDHLLHVWMPAARLPDELVAVWAELERRSGLTRQWEVVVHRIRDQVQLAGAELTTRTVDLRGGDRVPAASGAATQK